MEKKNEISKGKDLTKQIVDEVESSIKKFESDGNVKKLILNLRNSIKEFPIESD